VIVCPAMVSVPVRDEVPVLSVNAKATVPLPVPLAPDVMETHERVSVVVQLQPAAVVTLTLPVPAAAAGVSKVGAAVKVHGGGAPACVTVTVWPATVTLAVRGEVDVLAVNEKMVVPLPMPVAPELIEIQETLSDAAQLQPAAVVTLTLPLPATSAGLSEGGATVKVQGTGAPACVTVTV